MNGRNWKRDFIAAKLQEKSIEPIVDFVEKHIEDGLIINNCQNARLWLEDIYPDIMDESETDEQLISAFVGGMVYMLIDTAETGIRWVYLRNDDLDDT